MLTSRTNPVLAEFRDTAGVMYSFKDDLNWWVDCLNDPRWLVPINGDHWNDYEIDHARRVLSRLASFGGES